MAPSGGPERASTGCSTVRSDSEVSCAGRLPSVAPSAIRHQHGAPFSLTETNSVIRSRISASGSEWLISSRMRLRLCSTYASEPIWRRVCIEVRSARAPRERHEQQQSGERHRVAQVQPRRLGKNCYIVSRARQNIEVHVLPVRTGIIDHANAFSIGVEMSLPPRKRQAALCPPQHC